MSSAWTAKPWKALTGRVLALLAVVLAIGWVPNAPVAAAEWQPPTEVYIAQTGHNLAEPFLTYWRENSGATFLGNPISEQLTEGGLTVQYFERARLELHGETVALGLLGDEASASHPLRRPQRPRLLRGDEGDVPIAADPFARLPFALFAVDPDDHRFFAESGHTLRYSFKLAWEKNGGQERYGLPISEEFVEVSPLEILRHLDPPRHRRRAGAWAGYGEGGEGGGCLEL